MKKISSFVTAAILIVSLFVTSVPLVSAYGVQVPHPTYYPTGDVTSNGRIDTVDLTQFSYFLIDDERGGFSYRQGDIDGDGEITSTDLVLLKKIVSRYRTQFKVSTISSNRPTAQPNGQVFYEAVNEYGSINTFSFNNGNVEQYGLTVRTGPSCTLEYLTKTPYMGMSDRNAWMDELAKYKDPETALAIDSSWKRISTTTQSYSATLYDKAVTLVVNQSTYSGCFSKVYTRRVSVYTSKNEYLCTYNSVSRDGNDDGDWYFTWGDAVKNTTIKYTSGGNLIDIWGIQQGFDPLIKQ